MMQFSVVAAVIVCVAIGTYAGYRYAQHQHAREFTALEARMTELEYSLGNDFAPTPEQIAQFDGTIADAVARTGLGAVKAGHQQACWILGGGQC